MTTPFCLLRVLPCTKPKVGNEDAENKAPSWRIQINQRFRFFVFCLVSFFFSKLFYYLNQNMYTYDSDCFIPGGISQDTWQIRHWVSVFKLIFSNHGQSSFETSLPLNILRQLVRRLRGRYKKQTEAYNKLQPTNQITRQNRAKLVCRLTL